MPVWTRYHTWVSFRTAEELESTNGEYGIGADKISDAIGMKPVLLYAYSYRHI
jgi:hypothetical protein